jgi:polyphosphate kinase 2 (PPK2 family)
MDSAGKDGAIRHVISGVNPEGCVVYSFKQPSAEELKHDFLWRTTRRLPERGRIGIFNRSYYEEVLITRVHRRSWTHRICQSGRAMRSNSGVIGIAPSSNWRHNCIGTALRS